MAYLAYANFAGSTDFLGGSMTLSRGILPSRCYLRQLLPTALNSTTGTLSLIFGPSACTFTNCAVLETNNRRRDIFGAWEWDLVVVDRRWRWRYCLIEGVYNERASDGTKQTWNTKTIKQLMELCLVALGETNYTTTDVPTNVYPPVRWVHARADLELQWLCDLVGMVVILGLNDRVSICKLNDTAGAAMPSTVTAVTTVAQAKTSGYPALLQIQGDPSVIQSKLTLEAVGLDEDRKIDRIANLSYIPGGGWGGENPWTFSNVAEAKRWMAFQSVYRWYRPSAGWNGDGVTIDAYDQLELLDQCVETLTDTDGSALLRPLPAQVTGVFWPYCDHAINTASTVTYDGGFVIDRERGIVIFQNPVFKWSTGATAAADLSLTTSYRVRKTDSEGYSVYQRTKAVTNAGTGTRVIYHPELTKRVIVDGIYASAGSNVTALNTEADSYLTMLEACYDYTYSSVASYDGLLSVSLDGAISQVKWEWGFERAAFTRVGRNTEFEVQALHHRQQRAMARLERMMEGGG